MTDHPVVGIVAPGEMGAAMGAALARQGVRVLTLAAGRSAASLARARAASFELLDSDAALVEQAAMILSVVPPFAAVALAERFAPVIAAASRKPIYVDCNAIAPATMAQVAEALAPSGCQIADAGLFGGPTSGKPGTVMYVSGPPAMEVARLGEFGIVVRVVDGPVGAASALKLTFAGMNKGFTALGALMLGAAARSGAAEGVLEQLAETQPGLLAYMARFVPAMFPKAYRWAPEMDEIADFLADDPEAQAVFRAFGSLYRRLARDIAEGGAESAALRAICARATEMTP